MILNSMIINYLNSIEKYDIKFHLKKIIIKFYLKTLYLIKFKILLL